VAAFFYELQDLATLPAEQRLAILSIIFFLVVGLIMLVYVNDPKSSYTLRKAASQAAGPE
jgi:hypothetical protein